MNVNIYNPCYKCPNRRVDENYNCHSHCFEYDVYKRAIEESKEREREETKNFVLGKTKTNRRIWRPLNSNTKLKGENHEN